jgi:hypothetical protein
VAIAAGLLLAISGTSSGARQSRHLSGTHTQASVKEDRGVVSYPSRVPAYDPRGTSAWCDRTEAEWRADSRYDGR